MQRIAQRDLRNDNAAIMRRVEAGESFLVLRNRTPVAELVPVKARRAVPRGRVLAVFRGAPRIDGDRFRADLDALIDQRLADPYASTSR